MGRREGRRAKAARLPDVSWHVERTRNHAAQRADERIGAIDVLLTNYNHAGKLFGDQATDRVKGFLWRVVKATVDRLRPRWVVPFASSHYYRAPASVDQNASLLSHSDLDTLGRGDDRWVVLRTGDSASFGEEPVVSRRSPALAPSTRDVLDYGASVPWDQLLAAGRARTAAVRRGFFGLNRWFGATTLWLEDLERALVVDPSGRVREADRTQADVATHSQAAHILLELRCGEDTFLAGAHFRCLGDNTSPIRRWMLASLLGPITSIRAA